MRRYIEYVILIAATFYVGILYRSTAFILVGYGELLAGILMFGYLLCLTGKVSVRIVSSSDVGEVGKKIPVDLLISNKSFLPVAKVKVQIQDVYPLFGEKKLTTVVATVPGREKQMGETRIRLGYLSKHSGRLVLRIKRIRRYDFLGIFTVPVIRKQSGQEICFSIFPDTVSVPVVVERSTRDYAQEKEEQAVRGEEQLPEAWQIREYQPGDRLRAIHWKLSAKTEELMVNEHMTEAGYPVFVFLDYKKREEKNSTKWKKIREKIKKTGKNERKNLEAYFEVILSISFSLVENKCNHYIVWFDSKRQDVCRREIRSQEDVYLFFQELEDLGSTPEGMALEEWYQQKYRGNHGTTRLVLNEQFRCLRNGELVADYQGKKRKELLQKQELYV